MKTVELETPRLRLRRLDATCVADLDFIVEQLNQPSFIEHIADRGVRNREDAARYLHEGPEASFARHGFGLMAVERRDDATCVGMCGLLRRDYLEYPDIGYSLLEQHVGKGYAAEAAAATLAWGFAHFGLTRIAASTTLDNVASIRLLERLGFRFEGLRQLPVHTVPSRYFVIDAPTTG